MANRQPVLAVVSVLGKDQKGVVAQFATYMAERGVNIEDIEQRVVRGFFVMDMLVDLKDLTSDLSEIITGLLELGRKMEMEVRVHLHSERRQKKIALLDVLDVDAALGHVGGVLRDDPLLVLPQDADDGEDGGTVRHGVTAPA